MSDMAPARIGAFAGAVLIAAVTIFFLIEGRELLIPIAVAIVIWYLLTALARFLHRIPLGGGRLPNWLALTGAVVVVALAIALVAELISNNLADVAAAAPAYQANFENLVAQAANLAGFERPPDIAQVVNEIDVRALIRSFASTAAGIAGSFGIVIVYVVFLLIEQGCFESKFAALFPDPARREAFRAALPEEARGELTDEVYAEIERRIALYDSEVLQADRGFAAVLEHLEASGLADETLVVFTSDHGEGLWQRAPLPDETYDKANAYFPLLYFDHGIMLHSEQVHVPLVFRGPGVPAGERRGEEVSLLDVVPSVLARAGFRAPDRLHGRDVFDPATAPPRELFAVCSRGTTVTVDGRWRLHEPRDYRLERGVEPELFDLVADPGERAPVDDPARLATLRKLVALWRERHSGEQGAAAGISEEQRALLDSLGYTGGEADLGPPAEGGSAEEAGAEPDP